MTVVQSQHPEFTVAFRGYDRIQVDEYVDHLHDLLHEAEGRAREAEADYVLEEHASVGPRISEIFTLAESEARDVRTRIERESAELLHAARLEADRILDAAERTATEMQQRARENYEAVLAQIEREREGMRAEAAALEARKAQTVGELNRIRELLEDATSAPVNPDSIEQPAAIEQPLAVEQSVTREEPTVVDQPDFHLDDETTTVLRTIPAHLNGHDHTD